jgi:hypothetical protein
VLGYNGLRKIKNLIEDSIKEEKKNIAQEATNNNKINKKTTDPLNS